MQKLSKQELKSIMGGAVACCRPTGNQNPPKGGNRVCGQEPLYCETDEWKRWQECMGPDYPYPYTCS